MKTIKTKPATKANIKPFGQLVTFPKIKPTASDKIFTYWKQQGRFSFPGGKGEIGYLTIRKHSGIYSTIEAHLKTPELLIPLNCDMDIPLVPAGKKPDVKKLKAFRIKKCNGILIDKGVWHWLPQPVGAKEVHIIVVFADNTSQTDMTFYDLDTPIKIMR